MLQTNMDKSKMKMKMNNSGQIAIVLLLFALVALTIGLTVTQRSLTNISTSSQTEQVSRAFLAAEAGLERSLNQVNAVGPVPAPGTQDIPQSDLNNQADARVQVITRLPRTTQARALEYPPAGKDTFAQFWLASPLNTSNNWNPAVTDPANPNYFYGDTSVAIYFGNFPPDEPTNRPALEVNLITKDNATGNFVSTRTFIDSTTNPANPRLARNGFALSNSCDPASPGQIYTSNSPSIIAPADRIFLCYVTVAFPVAGLRNGLTPIMIRTRILYSNVKQPVAVVPTGTCPSCFLPYQAALYTSTGRSGQSQKTIQIFRELNFMPTFLDFAVFSSGSITK